MQAEMRAIMEHDVFEEVTRTEDKSKVIQLKRVFDLKVSKSGMLERYKARLVAKGFKQRFGINYTETFSPVLRSASVKLFMALATQFDLDLTQSDVPNAFLNATMEKNEEV